MFCVIRYVSLSDDFELEEFLHDGASGFYVWGQKTGLKTFETFAQATNCAIELNTLYGVPCCCPARIEPGSLVASLVYDDSSDDA